MGPSDSPPSFGIALLTISDTRAEADDESGSLMEEIIVREGFDPVRREIVREEPDRLREAFREVVDRADVDVLITSGGTGISHRDRTLEVLRPMLDRELPGFGELFRRLSFDEIGAYTVMSRATAGRIDTTVVFALPGSPNAVELALEEIVVPILPHAVREATKHAPGT